MKQLSEALSEAMREQGFIDEKESDIYEYCFDYFISQLKYDLIILLLGIIFRQPAITITYLLSFGFLRRYAGGYHAPGRLSCAIMSYLLYFVILAGAIYIPPYGLKISLILLISELAIITLLAPVSTPNKPIPDERRRIMKIKTGICSVLLLIACIIFYKIKALKCYVTVELCVIMVLVMLIIQLIINKRKA